MTRPARPDGALEIVLASANEHKAREIREIVAGLTRGQGGPDIELLDRPSGLGDVEETGSTLLDNARLKADAVMQATGRPAIADDTGLEVAALGGVPGVHSARYAGPSADARANTAKLLDALERAERDAHGSNRRARFRTVVVVVFPDRSELVAEGIVDGSIARAPRGSAGFGYDAVFEPDGGGGQTFAELGDEAKHALSHRGRALASLLGSLAGRATR